MKTIAVAASLLLSSFLFSCKKQDASDASTSAFSFQVKTINPSAALNRTVSTGRTAATSVQWTSGTASATLLKFEAKNAGGEIEYKQKVSQPFDLFAATSVLGNLTVPQGTYTEVEFKANLAPAGNAQALVLNGTLTTNGVSTPLSFQVASAVELKAEKANVTVSAGTNYSALNSIDLSQLTRNVSEADLTNAVRTNGTVILSANSNTALYNVILANLNNHHGEAEVDHH